MAHPIHTKAEYCGTAWAELSPALSQKEVNIDVLESLIIERIREHQRWNRQEKGNDPRNVHKPSVFFLSQVLFIIQKMKRAI